MLLSNNLWLIALTLRKSWKNNKNTIHRNEIKLKNNSLILNVKSTMVK